MKKKTVSKSILQYVQTLRYCLQLSWEASGYYTIIRILCEVFPPLLGIAGSFLGKYLLDLFAGQSAIEKSLREIFILTGCILLINIFQNAAEKIKQYIQTMHTELIDEKLSLMLMHRSSTVDMEYFDCTEYYDKLQAAVRDFHSISQILWNAMTFLGTCISLAVVFAVLWIARPLYAVLLVITAVPYSIFSTRYTKSLYDLSMEQMNAERKKSYFQGLTLDRRYAQDVRIFGIGGMLQQKYHVIWHEVFENRKSVLRKKTAFTVLFAYLPEIVMASMGLDIGVRILEGKASIGDYSLYMGMMGQFLSAFFVMAYAFTNVYDNRLRIENLKWVVAIKNKILDLGTKKLSYVDEIIFDHVSFSYPQTDRPVLKDVSFCLKKEEKTVFVGMNGSGKTTVIKLLLRLYEPEAGCIKINGIDIKEYRIDDLRKNFSVYFQEMGNYCMTIYENIEISDMERKDNEAVRQALEQSCCGDIMEKAVQGLNTGITRLFDKEGLELSGGQFQKIALARCFYRRHTVLVLDEPSSNLDPKTEHDIFENLKQVTEGKMTIFTSHRLSNVALADKIIVLERGQVTEEGTHDELLKKNGQYARLYQYQSKKFKTGEE